MPSVSFTHYIRNQPTASKHQTPAAFMDTCALSFLAAKLQPSTDVSQPERSCSVNVVVESSPATRHDNARQDSVPKQGSNQVYDEIKIHSIILRLALSMMSAGTQAPRRDIDTLRHSKVEFLPRITPVYPETHGQIGPAPSDPCSSTRAPSTVPHDTHESEDALTDPLGCGDRVDGNPLALADPDTSTRSANTGGRQY
ncbi:hypothetical protein EVG20_g5300 [Dentipellis fragilis]|uniref:Uncharacterized protein n=1 Tax=Dentipellis fragilis TaxID=205917 RepID=A0A4Y9YVM3_9AGAM|nr:hypothetical protein EVG20_g5300 [Dentipellis fragilis]